MKLAALHRWPRTPRDAIELQQKLAERVILRAPRGGVAGPRILAGADAAFSPDGEQVIAAVVVWDIQEGRVIETRVARRPLTFPYVPGLLSFRELPAILAAIRRLDCKPDAFLCDAHGLAHPRRFGLACHLGLWLDRPAIGCAKSRLCGEHDEPAAPRGAQAPLTHRGERIGTVLRTRDGVRPIYVSPGHRVDHAFAVRVALAAATRFRLPEPTRLADRLAAQAKASPRAAQPELAQRRRN